MIEQARMDEINEIRLKAGLPAIALDYANEVLGKAPAGVDDTCLVVYTGQPEIETSPEPLPPEPGPEPLPPVLLSLDPEGAEIGAEDVIMTCLGENFTADSIIVFNDGDEVTNYVSASEVTTIVKPSLASAAVDVQVYVKTGHGDSAPLTFSFVESVHEDEAATESSPHKRKIRKKK